MSRAEYSVGMYYVLRTCIQCLGLKIDLDSLSKGPPCPMSHVKSAPSQRNHDLGQARWRHTAQEGGRERERTRMDGMVARTKPSSVVDIHLTLRVCGIRSSMRQGTCLLCVCVFDLTDV